MEDLCNINSTLTNSETGAIDQGKDTKDINEILLNKDYNAIIALVFSITL